jgi:DNA-binding transcriptional ArsR family regulator
MNKPIRDAILLLRALDNKPNISIINILRSTGKMTVTEIRTSLNMEQSSASQRLRILRNAGVVQFHRDGKFVKYSLCDERINEYTRLAGELVAIPTKELKQY